MLKRGVCILLLVCAWSLDAAAAITMTPNPLDAGTTTIGNTTMDTGTLDTTMNAHVDLNIGACSGGGGTFTLNPNNNINLNGPQTITVTYSPNQRGTRQCTVDVVDHGNSMKLGSFTIRGTGQQPPTMGTVGTPDFGSMRWNNAAPNHTSTRNFTVSNSGDVTLDVTGVTITGTNAGDFTISAAPANNSILPGNSKTWTLQFDPSASGTRTATLTFTSNDPADGTDTFNLTGVGTNAIIVTPTDSNFGGLVSAGSSALGDVQVDNQGGTPEGPLGVTSASISGGGGWITFAGCGGGANCLFIPALSFTGSVNVGVRCSPPATAQANDMQTATITFNSDTDNATPDNSATLTCVAGRSVLAANVNNLGFGSQLVGTTTALMPLTVMNTGNQPTTFVLTKTGVNAGAFAVSTPSGCGTMATPCSVAAGGTQTVNVVFTAIGEGDINAGLTITSPSTPNPSLVLTGRGIDRHADVIQSLQFPDTFRNPGDMATVLPIPVKNVGEYPLHVSSVAIDGAGNWALAEPFEAFDVPGLGSHDVNVAFLPVTAGKAPDGTLAIMTDDTKAALVNVIVSGNGKDRN
ncbi:MAG TPA: choice-of-anchor D domain-containing protein, partial [Kofleriaceae bacterium]|nr:choice-of-anchor D domain-containing protein [Kofleriaceae bacterium]